jgi:hypothetical protein
LNKSPAERTAVLFEIAGSAAIGLYGFIVGCLIWNGVPYGKRVAKQYLLIRLFAFDGIEIVAFGLMADLPNAIVVAFTTAVIPHASGSHFYFDLVALFQAICSSEEHLRLTKRTRSWERSGLRTVVRSCGFCVLHVHEVLEVHR